MASFRWWWTLGLVGLLWAASCVSVAQGPGHPAESPSSWSQGPVQGRDDVQRQGLVNALLERIPPGASLSVEPQLMAYVGLRGSPFLFPVVGEAEYVLADAAASSDPLVTRGVYQKIGELLSTGRFGVVEARDGLALLRRGLSGAARLPDEFYGFLRAGPGQEAFPLGIRFADALELVAYDYETAGGDLARLVTYWQALRPLEGDYRTVFFLAPILGQLPEPYEDASLATLWYPPSRWQSGEVIKVVSDLAGRGGRAAQVAVYQQGQEGRRALPATLPGGASPEGAPQVLDLSRPPGEKVSLDPFIGRPFSPLPAPAPAPEAKAAALSLCGKPLEDASLARLRPVAVKIDNAPAARPQVGLGQACVVYEHMTEGGITRFTAIYHTEEAEVGPVRSARRVDLSIVPQYEALFAHVGAAPAVMYLTRVSQILDVDQFFHSEAYYYLRQRPAPHNVYTTVSRIRSVGRALGYGGEAELAGFPLAEAVPEGGRPAAGVLIFYSNVSQAEFRYDLESGDYLRFTGGRLQSDAADGQALRPRNVIIQRVPSWIVSYTEDAGGAPSLDFDLVGEGRATLLRGGMAFEGRWVRPSLADWTRFYDEEGEPLTLAPGQIWISLVSPQDGVRIG